MLDLMRKHAKSWVINVIIAVIAVVFVFWGAGTFRQRTLTKVASVNGEPIGVSDYQSAYAALMESARQKYRDMLSDEILQSLNLKKLALDSLIERILITQQAKLMGVAVTKDELQQSIAETPMFQVDGEFNDDQYVQMLGRFQTTPAIYEGQIREEMLIRKVRELISSMAKVAPEEVETLFHLINDKIDLEFVLFPLTRYLDQAAPTPEEIQAYFEKNQEKYRIPEKVKVEYMAFRPEDFVAKVDIPEDEIADYYEYHLDEYREPEKVSARHILFKLAPDASPEKEAEVKAKAEAVLKEARESKEDNFRDLAVKYSEGPTAPTGGALGWFSRDRMVQPFADVAFSLDKGQISDLVKTRFGYHIIKVEDKRPASEKKLDEVKDEIRKKKAEEKSQLAAAQAAEEMADAVGLSQNFEQTAKQNEVPIQTTGFISGQQPVPETGGDTKFNQVAISLKPGEIGPLLELANGYYLIKALERKDSYLPELREVEEKVKGDLTKKMAMDQAAEDAALFLKKSREKGEWALPEEPPTDQETEAADQSPDQEDNAASDADQPDKAPAKPQIKVEKTGPFQRNQPIPKVGMNPKINEAAFSLEKPGAFASATFQAERGYYVIRLQEKVPATDEEFAKATERLVRDLQAAKGQSLFQQWIDAVRDKSEITLEPGVI